MDSLSGYSGTSLKKLKEASVGIGDLIELKLASGPIRGTLVPRYLHDDDSHIVLKLKSGYNAGLRIDSILGIAKIGEGEKPAFVSPPLPKMRDGLPKVTVIGTGGTIASRVDYRTGAVHPAVSAAELYALMPELSSVAQVEPEVILSIYSENMEPADWEKITERVSKTVMDGASGVVITHGTDTMGYTAAALSFSLRGVPVPVVLVGAQRSSDRPSSDAYLNLIAAVSVAASADYSGVYVAMHADPSDRRVAVHLGTRVRKNHTSARDAFESVGIEPAAYWSPDGSATSQRLPRRGGDAEFRPQPKFESRVALIKFYPSMPKEMIDAVIKSGAKGIVLEGTGLGHVSRKLLESIIKYSSAGGIVCMTSQCVWGRVDMNVYDTGRDLLSAGVLPLEDTLAETALVKLMWSLANSSSPEETKRLMRSNLSGEMTERSEYQR